MNKYFILLNLAATSSPSFWIEQCVTINICTAGVICNNTLTESVIQFTKIMELYLAGIPQIQLETDSHYGVFSLLAPLFLKNNIARQVFLVNTNYITILRLYSFCQGSVSVKLSYYYKLITKGLNSKTLVGNSTNNRLH